MATGHLIIPRLRGGRAAGPGRRGAQAGLLALVLGSAAAVSVATGTAAQAASSCTTSGTTVTCTYTGAGTYQFPLPSGVTSLDVTAVGAAGGTFAFPGNPTAGGPGASVQDTAVPVSAYQGEMLTVVVGGAGGTSTPSSAGAGGSPGGGGAGGTVIAGVGPGAGGGGYSGLLDPAGTTALVIAGGGGGAGTGGGIGGAGDTGNGGGTGGGFGGPPCPASSPEVAPMACGGTGGSSTAGGQGGAGSSRLPGSPAARGSDGMSLAGGNGANAASPGPDGGGGGGGGFFGGGGGGSGNFAGGGGGGGSGVVGTLPGGLTSEMTATGPSSVTISYQVPDDDLSITPPASITTDATGPSGATVTYPAPSVSDPDDASPPVAVCTPASGTTFPVGTTTVNCSATDSDDSNSPVTTSFTVTVEGAAAQVSDLTGLVASFNLPHGAQSSFDAQLQAVQSDLQASHTAQACSDLTSVINHAKAQSGKQLTVSQASQIIAAAKQVQAVLAC